MKKLKFLFFLGLRFVLLSIGIESNAQSTLEYSFDKLYNYSLLTEVQQAELFTEAEALLEQQLTAKENGEQAEVERLSWEIYRRGYQTMLEQAEVDVILAHLKVAPKGESQTAGMSANELSRLKATSTETVYTYFEVTEEEVQKNYHTAGPKKQKQYDALIEKNGWAKPTNNN